MRINPFWECFLYELRPFKPLFCLPYRPVRPISFSKYQKALGIVFFAHGTHCSPPSCQVCRARGPPAQLSSTLRAPAQPRVRACLPERREFRYSSITFCLASSVRLCGFLAFIFCLLFAQTRFAHRIKASLALRLVTAQLKLHYAFCPGQTGKLSFTWSALLPCSDGVSGWAEPFMEKLPLFFHGAGVRLATYCA